MPRATKHPGWGGHRAGAGRPRVRRHGLNHSEREPVTSRTPVHVILWMTEGTPNLCGLKCLAVIERSLADGQRFGMSVVRSLVRRDRIELIVDAPDRVALSRAMKGLSVRIARGINRVKHRSGQVLEERYETHVLRTPDELRSALGAFAAHARNGKSRR